MGYKMILWIILVTVVTVYYLNIPPPELSPRLKMWYKKGNFLKYKDFNIFYIDDDGILTDDSTLLLIHGFPTSSYDWFKILDDVKEQYSRIIMPDMLGFGFTDKPKQYSYLITEQADILEAILESLSVKDVHIMSHDYGDTVALELLHRHNTGKGKVQVNSLCMLNGGVFPETNFPLLGQKALLVPVLGDLLAHISFYGTLKQGLGKTFGPQTQPSETDMRDFYAVVRYKEGNVVMSRLIHYITQRNENKERWVGALQTTKVPIHMIYGPADPVNPPVFIDHYKNVVPSPSIEVLPKDIGHYPQWEYPSGVVNSYLKFLETIKQDLGKTFGPQTQPSETDMRDFYAVVRYKEGNVVMSRLIHYITQRNENKERWVGALQTTKVPIHMIYGPADPVNPPVFIDHYKNVVPSPSIEVLPKDIGHYPQWEYPSGVVNSYLKFLETIKQE